MAEYRSRLTWRQESGKWQAVGKIAASWRSPVFTIEAFRHKQLANLGRVRRHVRWRVLAAVPEERHMNAANPCFQYATDTPMSLSDVLSQRREEISQRYLSQHRELLVWAFCMGVNAAAVIPKFRFGNEHVSDFVLLQSITGAALTGGSFLRVVLIELEPPTERPFTKAGVYGKRLNGAIAQVTDWLGWIRSNDAYLRASLTKAVRRENTYVFTRPDGLPICPRPSSEFANRFQESLPNAFFSPCAKVIIGRRSMLTDRDNRRRAVLLSQTNQTIEIVPYDRLVDVEVRFQEPQSEVD